MVSWIGTLVKRFSTLSDAIMHLLWEGLEFRICMNLYIKPKIYIRYADDIFIATHSDDKINKLKQTLEKKLCTKLYNQVQD